MPITEGGKFSPVQQIVSPGVFTRENDLSGLAQGVTNIGGAIVAPFADGPAFIPTLVNNVADLEAKFGKADGVYYGPYTAKEYLLEQGLVTVVRVGGLTGYWQKNPLVIYAEPGEWARNTDVGAITTASYMYLDTDSYTSNIQLQLSSSVLNSSGSNADAIGELYNSYTVARASSAEIGTFITSISSLSGSTTLSASLAASSSLGKVLKITTRDLRGHFVASVTGSGYSAATSNGSTNYALANFDYKKSRLSGSISSSAAVALSFDTNTFGATPGGVNTKPSGADFYYNYLTSSYTYSNGNVVYGLVFAKTTANTETFSSASFDVADSSGSYEFRYDISRLQFSGSTSVKFGPTAATAGYSINYNGKGGTLSGSVLYANKQVNIGTVSSGILTRKFSSGGPGQTGAGNYYLTSSIQGAYKSTAESYVSTAIDESTEAVARISSSILNGLSVGVDTDVFDYSGNTAPTFNSASFSAVRTDSSCGADLQFLGYLSGLYGKYNGSFVTSDTSGTDPCNPMSSSRSKLVLGVLANTQNGSTQFNERYEVFGFVGSTVSQLTSSTFPYSGVINPMENKYQLELKYSFTNDDGSTSAGTYGYYDFTLNSNDNLYLKNVFGTDPTAGNPATQVNGQKVEAAYSYVMFEDSIKKFKAEKVRANADGGGWRLRVDTAPSSGFSVGESMKFVDTYSLAPTTGDSAFSITNAYTPWIHSQQIAPFKGSADETATATKFKLFKVHTLSDGTKSNVKYKVEISNVKLAGTVPGSDYGSFTLSIRSYSDTDKRPKYLETFQNLNLDPDSANYIARRIGDRYQYITYAGKIIEFGTYSNLSKYVRIEMNTIKWPETAVPYGFAAYNSPVDSTLSNYLPVVRYSKASIYGLNAGKYASGTVFGEVPGADDEIKALYPTSSLNVGVETDTKQYFKPLPYYGSNDQNGDNIDFDLEDKSYGTVSSNFYANSTGSLLAPSLSGSVPSTYDAVNETTYVKMRKFIVGFQGGFDGQWPAIPINVGSDITAGNTQGLDCTNINSAGSVAYSQCIGAIGNADEFDINLIVLPGIFREQHSYVTELTIDMCEARGDCFYIMDNVVFPASNQTVGLIDSAINSIATIDSNYVATYYPWVKILDTNLNKIVSVPPSVVLPAVYAASDNSSAEWYAPAGLNRGGIPTAVQVLDRVTHTERDILYEGRVNPIASFPGQGICAWGQKTLQVEESALDRVNVRRLLINLKKFIASSSRFIVFEQNVASTRNRFLAIVNPYLESVMQRNGLYAFQVKMDDENNTPSEIDRNILYGQIFIQPAKSAEFIVLDFNILPSGASFSG